MKSLDLLMMHEKNYLIKKNKNLLVYDSIIINITCHGKEGTIICSDEKEYQIHKLQYLICRNLAKIPKIFIIDCCRGTIDAQSHPSKF